MSERSKRWRAAHPEYGRAYDKRWRAAHPDYNREYGKRWRAANKDKMAAKARVYRAKHRGVIKVARALGIPVPAARELLELT